MLINYTPEEQRQIEAIRQAYEQRMQEAADNSERAELRLMRANALYEFGEQCERRRFEKLGGDLDAILKDAKKQIPGIIKQGYTFATGTISPEEDKTLELHVFGASVNGEQRISANFAADLIRNELRLHIEAIKQDDRTLRKLFAYIVNAIKNSEYTDNAEITLPETGSTALKLLFKSNMPMYHGKVTDTLSLLVGVDAEENTYSDRATIQTKTSDGDYKVVIQDFSKLRGNLSINTDKLLCTAVAEFTRINNYSGGVIHPQVSFPFDEYARRLGYEIDERPTSTPEQAEKEKKRAAGAVKNAKKRIKQDLDLLQAMRITWTEKVKGKVADYDSISILDRTSIKKGYITIGFGHDMANYLKRLPITQYPQGLLAVDARKPNAYNMGYQMAVHYNMDNNQRAGTATRLKVTTLLSYTSLPTFEDLQNERQDNSRQWYTRIKEPFEAALDELTGKVIKSWEYVKAKGEPLTEQEAYGINDYAAFSNLLVQFELIDAPDHEDRLERRDEDKKRATTKKAAAKKKRGRPKKEAT